MGLEDAIERLREQSDAYWPTWFLAVRGQRLTERQRRALEKRIETGARMASDGDELLIRVTRKGVVYMVRAQLKSVRRLTPKNGPKPARSNGGLLG